MSVVGRWMTLSTAALVPACAPSQPRAPETPLERALLFSERGQGDRAWSISDDGTRPAAEESTEDEDVSRVTRVFESWPIDVDARLRIELLRDELLRGTVPTDVQDEMNDIDKRQKMLVELLEELRRYLDLRKATLEAYTETNVVLTELAGGAFPDESIDPYTELFAALRETDEFVRFRELRAARGKSEERVVNAAMALAPEDSAERDAIEAQGNDFSLLYDYLQGELDAMRARRTAVIDTVSFRLRLVATLTGPGKSVRVHVPGYDNIPKGSYEPLDRFGIRLREDQLRDFEEMNSTAQKVAAAGNAYLDGEKDVLETFAALADTQLGVLANFLGEIDQLAKELERDALQARIDATRSAFETLSNDVADAVGETTRKELEQTLESVRDAALGQTHVATLVRSIAELQRRLRTFRPDQLPAILEVSKTIADTLDALVTDGRDVFKPLEKARGDVIQAAEAVGSTTLATWNGSSAKSELDGWIALFERIKTLVDVGEGLVWSDSFPPLPSGLDVPDAIDMPVSKAKGTTINLQNTPRRPGDRLAVQAYLLRGAEPIEEPYTTEFDVEWLGWHAWLDPSVILARPDSGLAGSANFRFGTAVSWLWTYDPRVDQDAWYDEFYRYTSLAIGPHASILPFNPDKEVEIGLGLTASLWNGILQGGIGWNLMEEESDARLYYFLGSSLIPLVQAVGNRLPGSTTNNVVASE